MKRLFLALIMVVFFAVTSYAKNVTIQWDANTEPDLAGYKVYYDKDSFMSYSGTDAEQGESPIMVPLDDLVDSNNPEFTLTNLNGYTDHYIVVTAYDSEIPILESDYSNEVVAEKVFVEGPPSRPINLIRIWESVKRFFKWFNPWKSNLKIISKG